MAKYTNNLGLKKPDGVDHVLVNDLNENFEIIDEAIASGSMAKGLKPSGLYATYDELVEAIVNPEVGATYLVGEFAPYELYTWTGNEWVLAGTTMPVRGVDYWTEEDVQAINEEVAKATRKIDDMTVAAQSGDEAKAEISEIDGAKHIDFTLPKGDKGDQGEQGEQGIQGERGIQGETGLTPNITFEVSTGAAGSDVQVAQSGTVENPIVHLTIPRGNPGQNGTGSGTVTSVNGVEPDANGNVTIEVGDADAVKSVNGVEPDENGNVQIQTGGGGANVEYYDSTPSALGEAYSGSSAMVARGDHVHPMPSPEDIGSLKLIRANTLDNMPLQWNKEISIDGISPWYSSWNVPEVLENDTVIMDLVASSDPALAKLQLADYAKIYKATAFNGRVEMWATEQPQMVFSIQFLILR